MKGRKGTTTRQVMQQQKQISSTADTIDDLNHQCSMLCYKEAIEKVKLRIDTKLHILLQLQAIEARKMIREGGGEAKLNDCSHQEKEQERQRENNYEKTSTLNQDEEDPRHKAEDEEEENIERDLSLLLGLRSSPTRRTSAEPAAEPATVERTTRIFADREQECIDSSNMSSGNDRSMMSGNTNNASSLGLSNSLLTSTEHTGYLLSNIIEDHRYLNELISEANHHGHNHSSLANQQSQQTFQANIQIQHDRAPTDSSNEEHSFVDWPRTTSSPWDHRMSYGRLGGEALSTASSASTIPNPNLMVNTNTNNLLGGHDLAQGRLQLYSSLMANPTNPLLSSTSTASIHDKFAHGPPHRSSSLMASTNTSTSTSNSNFDQIQVDSTFTDDTRGHRTHRVSDERVGGANEHHKQDYSSFLLTCPDSSSVEEDSLSKKRKAKEEAIEYQEGSSSSSGKSKREFSQKKKRYENETVNTSTTIATGTEQVRRREARGCAYIPSVSLDVNPESSAMLSLLRTRNHESLPAAGMNNVYPYSTSIRSHDRWPYLQENSRNYGLSTRLQQHYDNPERRREQNLFPPTFSSYNEGQDYLTMLAMLGGRREETKLDNSSSLLSRQNDSSTMHGENIVSAPTSKPPVATSITCPRQPDEEEVEREGGQKTSPMTMGRRIGGTGDDFLPLGLEQDSSRLSQFLCFLRLECIEVFTATNVNVLERMSSKKVKVDQVGIRCVFCSHLNQKQRAGRSSNFPSSISRLYQGVSMMIYKHFPRCNEIPVEIRSKYESLRKQTKKGDKESRSYWIESAKIKGLVDCGKENGIRFSIPNENPHPHKRKRPPSCEQSLEKERGTITSQAKEE